MKITTDGLRDLMRDEQGATAVEYALMLALIAVVIVAAVAAIGPALSDRFAEVAEGIRNASGSGS